ncbi:MAG: transglycosylase SLT domain-containing protein [Saezia sp.]
MQASEAFKKNDSKALLGILPQVKGHPMESWVHYWSVRSRIRDASPEEIRAVFQRWPHSYVEDRLRNDWLLLLGERGDWQTFSQEYAHFKMRDDSQVLCYALLIDYKNSYDAVSLGREEFLKIRPPYVTETGCNMLASQLYADKKLPASEVWIKLRRLVELNRISATQKAMAILNPKMDSVISDLMKDPDKWLREQKKGTASKTSVSDSELLTLALIRWAAKNPEAAIKALRGDWKDELDNEQKSWVYAVAGRITAIRLNPKALDYFNLAAKAKGLNEETIEWHARARLRAAEVSKKSSDWQKLTEVIDAMPEDLRKSTTWVFWKAIALKRVSSQEKATHPLQLQAKDMLESIAGYDGFYEQLATEELGQAIMLSPNPMEPTQEEMNEAIDTAGLMRALYAFNLGLRSEGSREWNWNLRDKSDRFLQAAAQLACDQHVWDRCINTSERAKGLYNVKQRFPMPYKEIIVPRAYELKIDPAYVLGLIRQESRFIADIKSAVGATGLMQLMPATAKWTAKEIGMTDYTPDKMIDPQSNVKLGTAYLKLSLDEFNGSQALAAAAYNAGPSRSRNWRKGPVLDGAVWAENIPFNETRNYVKTVLSAAVVYDMLLTGQSRSLKARLGQIAPAQGASVSRADLP